MPSSRKRIAFPYLLQLFIVFTFNARILCSTNDVKEQCRICRSLVRSFEEGMEKTVKLHFGGGNTDWEEKKLGKFRTSETRFVEVMEHICGSDDKESRFKCHSMAEKHEELLEQWFFNHQENGPNLEKFLCNEKLEYCCEHGHFGKECSPCPGMQSGKACFGRGSCEGSGSRTGSGECACWRGYVGKMCSNCDANFFALSQNSTFIECQECFDGCAGGCTGEGPKGCKACRSGYEMSEDLGCADIDECAQDGKCTKANEVCVNTEGSYECKCADGFKRTEAGDCELDFEEESEEKQTDDSEDNEKTEKEENEEADEQQQIAGQQAEYGNDEL